MSDFEAEIRAAMRAHDDEAPTVEQFLASNAERGRPMRRARWIAAAVAAAMVLAVAAIAIAAQGGHPGRPAAAQVSATSAGSATITAPVLPLTCPDRYGGTIGPMDTGWVPAAPRGVDGTARLVPLKAPTRVVICNYMSAHNRLTGSRGLSGDLSSVSQTLAWAPPRLHGQGGVCGAVVEPVYTYLVGLTYRNGAVWVFVHSGDCGPYATNGRFTSLANLFPFVRAAYRSGHWGANAAVDHHRITPHGRLGQETTLVPAEPTRLRITVEHTFARGRPTTTTVTVHNFRPLVDALDGLPTRSSSEECQGDPDGKVSYYLQFGYPVGPAVDVNVTPWCRPSIDNESLQADGADTVVPIIRNLLPHS